MRENDINFVAYNMKNLLENVTIRKHKTICGIKETLVSRGALGAMTVSYTHLKDIEASEGIETLKETESINRLVASKETELMGKSMIRVGMDKPQISKVLKCSLNLHKKEVKVGEDKVYLGCYCKLKIIYLGDDPKELVSLEDDVRCV